MRHILQAAGVDEARLKLIKEVHKKYGNFGSDIAKVHLGKIYEKTLGGKALLL